MFAGLQFFLSIFLLLDIQFYDYVLRPIRLLSYLAALVYNTIYIFNAALAFDLLYIQDFWKADDSQAIPDFMLASISGYSVIHFSFTAFFNMIIILKELTMDQFALSKKEDFETGVVPYFGWNIDLFYWAGVDSNTEDYWEKAREFSRIYL